MKRSARLAFLSAASLLTTGGLLAENAPLPFSEATFTEVINDVQVISGADSAPRKAAKSDKFLAPDLVKTGRKSRAELKAADGTVARVGSNAVFAFDKSTRSMNLKSGSVLFHSPTGKGGGTVVTNSATASVVGTTIMVTATSDGGFKLLVLEGVAKVTLNGVTTELKPGQMTFVLPAKSGEQPKLGPVLNFDLEALAAESNLVGGFDSPLDSIGKIRDAIAEQGLQIEDGDLRKTGLFIIGAEDESAFRVADAATIRQTVLQQAENNEARRLADSLRTTLVFDGSRRIPEANIFRNRVFLTPALLGGLVLPGNAFDEGLVGVLVGRLTLNTPVFNLGFIDGAADTLTLAGVEPEGLVIPGGIIFEGLSKSHTLRIVGGTLVIAPGSQVEVIFDNATVARPVSAEFIALRDLNLTDVSFKNATGDIELGSLTGDVTLADVTVVAGTPSVPPQGPQALVDGGDPSYAPARVGVHAESGAVTIAESAFTATGEILVEAATTVTLDGVNLDGGSVRIKGDTGVTLANGTDITATGGGSIEIIAGDGDVVLGSGDIRAYSGQVAVDGFSAGENTVTAPPAPSVSNIRVEGLSVRLDGAYLSAAGYVSLKSTSGVTAVASSSLQATGVSLNGASINITDTFVGADSIFVELSPGVLATDVTVSGSTLDGYGSGIEAPVQLRANTLVLDGVAFNGLTTLRVQTGRLSTTFDGLAGTSAPETGKANIHASNHYGTDLFAPGQLWVPAENIGDVTAPVHILDATTGDFRGTKLAYASVTPLTLLAESPFLPNSYKFFSDDNAAQDGPILLTDEQLGLPDGTNLPAISTARTEHSAYELTGIFAGDLTLDGAHLDLSSFDNNDAYQHVDVVAARMHLSGDITVDQLFLVESLEFRAGSLTVSSGTTLHVTGDQADPIHVLIASAGALTLPDFTLSNPGGDVVILSNTSVTMTGGLLEAGGGAAAGDVAIGSNGAVSINGGARLDAPLGGVQIESASGVTISGTGTLVSAGDVEVSALGDVVIAAGAHLESRGEVRINAGNPDSPAAGGDITLNSAYLAAGEYDSGQGELLSSGEVSLNAVGTLAVSSGDITVFGDSGQDTGSITLGAKTVNLTNSTLRVVDQAVTDYSGYIDITASLAVTIDGGFLKARDIRIVATDAANGIVTLKNNPTFVGLAGSADAGIAISAKTVVLSDVSFPANTEIRLRSGDGVLNLGAASGNQPVFGAVNFMRNITLGVGEGGLSTLVDGAGLANASGINSHVWVENTSPGNILVNGNPQTGQGVTGASSPTGAAIHVQQTGSSNAPGIHAAF